MLTRLRPIIVLFPVLLLVACASKPSCEKHELHLDARPGPEVELPAARGQGAWKIPEAASTQGNADMRRRSDGSCLDQPPAFVPPKDAAIP
ncbi:MAG: hypothetical protein V4457_05190 [Pseudomonadota bacterium]